MTDVAVPGNMAPLLPIIFYILSNYMHPHPEGIYIFQLTLSGILRNVKFRIFGSWILDMSST